MTQHSDIDELFETLARYEQDKQRPPVHLWHPERVGEIDIEIQSNGDWVHEGSRFQRHALVKLFASILRREGEQFFLVTPVEKLAIRVVDAPFVVIDMDHRGSGVEMDLLFTTNVGDHVIAGDEHPLIMQNGIPYVMVRDGLTAKLNRNVFYRLVELGSEQNGELIIHSDGARFSLGSC